MNHAKRVIAFWFLIIFMSLSSVIFFLGQTSAVFFYDFAVSLGLQEDVIEIGEFGVAINRAFGVSDTLVYIPLIILSVIGLIMKKKWALFTSAAVMGISTYWATTVAFILLFLEGVPDYHFIPTFDYWAFIFLYIIFGLWGLWYLIFRGESLIS